MILAQGRFKSDFSFEMNGNNVAILFKIKNAITLEKFNGHSDNFEFLTKNDI